MKQKNRLIALILIISFVLCGCSNKELLLSHKRTSYDVNSVTSFITNNNTFKSVNMSNDICVIPENTVAMPEDMFLRSHGVLLVDIDTNEMILSKNIYEKMYPASLTKMATALVCLKYGNLDDMITVSYAASHINEPGAKLCFLQEGDVIDFRTLLTAFVIYSGNDAGVALAEHISGTEAAFAELMNKELKKIGAVNTHFVNSHGLPDDNHYTSVYDMYLVLNELMKYEEFCKIAALDSITATFKDASGKDVTKIYENTNQYLMGFKKLPKGISILASKTGTTLAAGSCLCLTVQKKKKHRYIAVVMKAPDSNILYNEMNIILEHTK